MKSFTKLTLTALTIAVCFVACTKDNSVSPASSSQPTVKFTSKTSTALKLKDTIAPQVKVSKKVAPLIASRDTIAPR